MTLKAAIVLFALMLLAGMISKRFGPRVDRPKGPEIEAARKCPTCGAYALAGALCGRADCPHA